MYPHYLMPYVWKGGGFQVSEKQVLTILLNKESGTFAFYQINKSRKNTDYRGRKTKVTMEQALFQAGGNTDLAKMLMVTGRKSIVGLAYITLEQQIKKIIISCKIMMQKFHSFVEFISDIKKNFPVDENKLLSPGMNYTFDAT